MWAIGRHWCVVCRASKSTSAKYWALTPREEVEYEEALAMHKRNNVKKMPRICDTHLTPLRTSTKVVDKSSWDTEGLSSSMPGRKRKTPSSAQWGTPPPKVNVFGNPYF